MWYEPESKAGAVRAQLGGPYETRESKQAEEQKRQAASGAARLQLGQLGDASVQPCNRSGTGG